MDTLVKILTSVGSTAAGQDLLAWVVSSIWKVLRAELREQIANAEIQTVIAKKEKEYADILKLQELLNADGLTEEEKNEIRKSKYKAISDIINART